MDTVKIGKTIAEARKRAGLTQEQLAEKIGVTPQAVSKWESGHNIPDLDNLFIVAEVTNTPYQFLLGDPNTVDPAELDIRARLFREENMYTRIKSTALAENLTETYKALQFMRNNHADQFRRKSKFTEERVHYINHPLIMACQAHALKLKDDALIASILLHDVVEDTDVKLDNLPFCDEVKEIVGLVTKPDRKMTQEDYEKYYDGIAKNGKACMVKILDRCNNISTMVGVFSRERMLEYVQETEQYIMPLTIILKNQYPEYSDAAFLIKYHMISVLEIEKCMLVNPY